MSILSGIGDFLFGSSPDFSGMGETAAQAQQEGLDYMKGVDAPLLDYRNKALGSLSDYYMGGPGGQQSFYDTAMQSPAYHNLVGQGEEAVLRNATATGGLRGGAVQPALAQNSQNVLQGLVNQNLQGLGSFASPNLNTGSIANLYGNIGQTRADAMQAGAQFDQSRQGGVLGGLLGLGSFLI